MARFVAEGEGGVVDGEELGSRGVGRRGAVHGPGFLGGGVGVVPGFVAADAEGGEFEVAEAVEGVGHGGVAGEEDAAAVGVAEDVAVVAAAAVEGGAGAPVAWAEGGDVELARVTGECVLAVPVELDHFAEALGNEARGFAGGDDADLGVGEGLQRGDVEVVKVGVREEDEVDRRQSVDGEGERVVAREAEGATGEADADAVAEDGVEEDGEAGEAGEDRAVAEPCRCEWGGGEAGEGNGGVGGWGGGDAVHRVDEGLRIAAEARACGPPAEVHGFGDGAVESVEHDAGFERRR